MTSPDLSAQLETASDEVNMAQLTLDGALHNALHSALHSTYTAAIKRIMKFNQQTKRSLEALLADLKRHASQTLH